MQRHQVTYMCWQQAVDPAKEDDLIILDGIQVSSRKPQDKPAFSIAQDIMDSIESIKKIDPIELQGSPNVSVRVVSDAVLLEYPGVADDNVGRGRPIIFYHILPVKKSISSEEFAKIATHLRHALHSAKATQSNEGLLSQVIAELGETIKKKRASHLSEVLLVCTGLPMIAILTLLVLGFMTKRDLLFLSIGMLLMLPITKLMTAIRTSSAPRNRSSISEPRKDNTENV